MVILGERKQMGEVFQAVAFPNFPYEVWKNKEGKLCRFLHCIGFNISIVDGEGTIISKKGFTGHVVKDGYKENGEIETDAGVITLPIPKFIQDILFWEQFIFNRVYDENKDPYKSR